MAEVWKPIAGYEGIYEVSNLGRVKSLARMTRHGRHVRERILTRVPDGDGYAMVGLSKDGVDKIFRVSGLVAAAFIGPRPAGFDVCHGNGDRLDDREGNLRYDTRAGNCADKRAHGTHLEGEALPQSKLNFAKVHAIRLLAGLVTQRALAKQFGVCQVTIRHVVTGKSWRHV